MQIIIVTNYRRKLALLTALIFFQVLMFYTGVYLMKNSLLLNISIDGCLEFSYPLGMAVDDIFVNEQAREVSIQSSGLIREPASRQFTNYQSLQGKFSFDYPSAFALEPQEFNGADILYHITFRSKTEADQGFVQVWNMPSALEDFLKKSLDASRQTFRYFKSGSLTVNGVPGYYWDYSVRAGDEYYKGSEVFLKKDGRMYRISYFVPESDWNEQRAEMYKNIVRSFKIL